MEKRFPQYLSAMIQILWFEIDELAVGVIFFILALSYWTWTWGLMMFAGPYFYSKTKRKYPRGFFKHCLYFIGFAEMKGYPPYFEKEFIE